MGKRFPYVYNTIRKIRGEKRKVKVTKYSRLKESLEFLNPKSTIKDNRKISRNEARIFQNSRSKKAKVKDAEQSVTTIKTAKWLKYPNKYDYPNVDTEGRGSKAGQGRDAGRKMRWKKLRHKKKSRR